MKNATAVTVLAGYVESGDLKPYVQEYFPLSGVDRAFNISALGGVVGESELFPLLKDSKSNDLRLVWQGNSASSFTTTKTKRSPELPKS